MMKYQCKTFYACLCFVFLLLSCRNEATQEVGMYTSYEFPDTATVVKTADSNLYFGTDPARTIQSYYLEGYDDVPFISVRNSFTALLKLVTAAAGNYAPLCTVTADDSTVTITRTDLTPSVSMTFNASAQTISSAAFMQFCTYCVYKDGCNSLANPVTGFCEIKSAGATKAPSTVTFDINSGYGLKMYSYTDLDGNKDILIPAQLAGNILLDTNNGIVFTYNGSSYYINSPTSIEKSYFTGYGRGGTRTRAEAEFNYRLLCMLFDKYYCLQHLRTADMNYGFNTFVFNNNMEQKLLSADPDVYDAALVKVLMTYVDDGHTNYYCPSYYQDASEIPYYNSLAQNSQGKRRQTLFDITAELNAARKAAFGITDAAYAGGLRYIEDANGNKVIAVITFDSFGRKYNGYAALKTELEACAESDIAELAKIDSFAQFYAALYRIKTDYPSVKNIIIDESCNGGGVADACVYLANLFVPDATFYYRNQLDGSYENVSYQVDTDLDGDLTDTDGVDLSTYKVFILTSEFSFSCGNLFPSILKYERASTDNLYIIGKQSGGGAGIVMPSGTGDGALIRTSSSVELTQSNGTSIDGGVPVDIELEHSVYYDDTAMLKALSAYMN